MQPPERFRAATFENYLAREDSQRLALQRAQAFAARLKEARAMGFRRVFAPDMSSGGRIVFNSKVRRLTGGSTKGIYLFE